MSSYDYSFKVLVAGDADVGKTTFMIRSTKSDLLVKEYLDAGTFSIPYRVKVQDKIISLSLWLVHSGERYEAMHSIFYKGASAALVLFDLGRRETLLSLFSRITEIRSISPDCLVVLVGSKSDLDHREIFEEEGQALAESMDCIGYVEVGGSDDSFIYPLDCLAEQLYLKRDDPSCDPA